MSDFLSRTAPYQYRRSVNDPYYPVEDWIKNPDMSAVDGWAAKYWTVSGDTVSLLDQASRDAIDAVEASAQKDATADQTESVGTWERAFAEVVLDEINTLRAQHALADRTLTQLRNAVREKL